MSEKCLRDLFHELRREWYGSGQFQFWYTTNQNKNSNFGLDFYLVIILFVVSGSFCNLTQVCFHEDLNSGVFWTKVSEILVWGELRALSSFETLQCVVRFHAKPSYHSSTVYWDLGSLGPNLSTRGSDFDQVISANQLHIKRLKSLRLWNHRGHADFRLSVAFRNIFV